MGLIKYKSSGVIKNQLKTTQLLPDDFLDRLTYIVRATSYSARRSKDTDRNNEVFALTRDEKSYEVHVSSSITLEDYQSITPIEDWELLVGLGRQLKGKTVIFINPTWEGGGVAMLRPPLVHVLKMLGVDARWYVMSGRQNPEDPNPFLFTKLMHNISQRRTEPEVRISDEGKEIHRQWNENNFEILKKQESIITADIIVLDDPQPAPLKKMITKINPKAKWVWRNHIDTSHTLMSDPKTPQGEIAQYILKDCGIKSVDAVVAHPVPEFMHPGMEDKTYFAPATVEPHDDLNRPLKRKEIKAGIDFINGQIVRQNRAFSLIERKEDILPLINTKKPRVALVARFDESKGMDKALEIGVRVRELLREAGKSKKELPQIIIVGNGSVDDPSGLPLYEEMLRIRREQYPEHAHDIIVMRLKHNYLAINALMYPTPSSGERRSAPLIAMQTSEAEGCETRISDWIRHGVPVVVSNRGGMSLQVIEGQSGVVIDFDKPDFDLQAGAEFIASLISDQDKYAETRKNTLELADVFNNREFTTTANATRFLRIFYNILNGYDADKIWKIADMIEHSD